MKTLSVSATSSGVHFVRCMRINLDNSPNMVQTELVRQQIRAMATVDTALAGKKGYPYRIPFQEFLRRYKFLAFDFTETVELTRDNCRLLLIRLKMDGWIIGKTKVFLKFYNVEYLSRLYEVQVKKIVKVQAMMRTFLARRVMGVQIKKKLAKVRQNSQENAREAEKAALFIQKGSLPDWTSNLNNDLLLIEIYPFSLSRLSGAERIRTVDLFQDRKDRLGNRKFHSSFRQAMEGAIDLPNPVAIPRRSPNGFGSIHAAGAHLQPNAPHESH